MSFFPLLLYSTLLAHNKFNDTSICNQQERKTKSTQKLIKFKY